MKKCIALSMVFLLVAFPILENTGIVAYATFESGGLSKTTLAPVPTVAEGTTILDNGMICATANVLTWEMLQTYLYAITGQQAYDVYANNEEEQEKLYSDFVDFCQETSYGSQVAFKMNVNTVASTTLSQYALLTDVLSYYKTAGSSALSDINNTTKAQLKVIMGGNNNLTPAPTNSAGNDLIGSLKNLELIGNSALTYYIGQYISKLVNGERGEVSETFLNLAVNPELYFDGNYEIVDGYYKIKTSGTAFYSSYNPTMAWGFRIKEDSKYCRPCLYYDGMVRNSNTTPSLPYTELRIMARYLPTYPMSDAGNDSLALQIDYGAKPRCEKFTDDSLWYSTTYVAIGLESIACFSGIPVFENYQDALTYLVDGNASKALNYFQGQSNPENWFDYDYSQISSKLDKILAALTTLPTITTDDLTGFAQGVANGVVAGNIPASDPATQQELMERLLEEQARQTASESMATATENDLLPDYDNTVPLPTRTPEQEQQVENIKDAKMVVDLHEFFPFCVPFDLVRLIKVLHAEPQAPCFETAIKYDKLNINVPIKLDLSQFDDAAKVFRLCEVILFILSLILITRNIIRG